MSATNLDELNRYTESNWIILCIKFFMWLKETERNNKMNVLFSAYTPRPDKIEEVICPVN